MKVIMLFPVTHSRLEISISISSPWIRGTFLFLALNQYHSLNSPTVYVRNQERLRVNVVRPSIFNRIIEMKLAVYTNIRTCTDHGKSAH